MIHLENLLLSGANDLMSLAGKLLDEGDRQEVMGKLAIKKSLHKDADKIVNIADRLIKLEEAIRITK